MRSANGSSACWILHGHSEFRQRQAYPQLLGLAQRRRRRAHLPHLVHGGDQFGIGGKIPGVRPVGQVHRALTGHAPPDHLGGQRQQWRGQPAGHLQHGVQRVDGVGVLLPEPRTRPSHIPIRQRLGELAQLVAGAGDVADIQRLGEVVAQRGEFGEDVAVQHVGRIRAPGALLRGVERQERVGVPERQQHLADAFADALLGDDQVAAAQDWRGHQEPAHGVGAVAVEHLGDVGIVAQRLAHLLPVVAEHDAVRHAGAERRAIEQRGGQHVQRVEPAAGLPDVFDDEVARVVAVEPVDVLKRVVHLGIRHRPRVEPHVEHIGDAPHRRAPGRVVGIGPGQFVDVGPVQVGRADAEVTLQIVEAAVDVDARIGRIVGHPHRNRRAPVAVSRDRPVARTLQPLAELAVLDVVGIPGDLLVEFDHAVAELGHLDEPRRHRPVDQRVSAPPAVRIAVLVGFVAKQDRAVDRGGAALVLQVADDLRVGVEDMLTGVLRDGGVEAALGVDRGDRDDVGRLGGDHVVLAVGRRHVHDAGAVLGGDEITGQHLKSVGASP